VVGFGTYRDALQQLAAALQDGDLDAAREIAARGRELEGGPPGGLSYLRSFLDGVGDDYLRAARGAFERVYFTGRLEHEDLPQLLASSSAQVVPSTFPESFGMVAAEAAACGALPLSAAHSGLAEVSQRLREAVEDDVRPLLSFELGPGAVEEIARKLGDWLTLPRERRSAASAALSDFARAEFGWEGVARGVVAAAEGRLADLARPSG
jgi:glycosyltransferase involved in cell wall biosynthesis